MSEPAVPPTPVPVTLLAAGEYLFREGERHGTLCVIESGQVELLRAVAGGVARLALLGPGDVAGEDCAFGRRASGCSARAVTDSAVVRVAAGAFEDVLRVSPEVAAHVIASLGRRLLEARVKGAAALTGTPAGGGVNAPEAAAPTTSSAAPPQAARFVNEENGRVFPLPPEGQAVVGRADPRTRFQPEVELSSLDTGRSLSRRHAVVSRVGDGFVLTEEAHVANGTFVNGARLKPGVAAPIRDGDEVCFGLVRTVFRSS